MPTRSAPGRPPVLAAARALLAEQGVGGVSIDAVARRAGVARSTVYRHFRDRAELLAAAIDELTPPPPRVPEDTVRDDLRTLCAGLAAALQSSTWSALVPALLQATDNDARYGQAYAAAAERRQRDFLDAVERGVSRGELPPGTDGELVADLLAGAVYYRRLVSRVETDDAFLDAAVDAVLAACRAGS